MFVSAVVALVAVPALAAEFYIVQDVGKQTCTITQEPPKGDGFMLVGDGAYGDEDTATSDMKRTAACNPRDAFPSAPRAPTGLKASPN